MGLANTAWRARSACPRRLRGGSSDPGPGWAGVAQCSFYLSGPSTLTTPSDLTRLTSETSERERGGCWGHSRSKREKAQAPAPGRPPSSPSGTARSALSPYRALLFRLAFSSPVASFCLVNLSPSPLEHKLREGRNIICSILSCIHSA